LIENRRAHLFNFTPSLHAVTKLPFSLSINDDLISLIERCIPPRQSQHPVEIVVSNRLTLSLRRI